MDESRIERLEKELNELKLKVSLDKPKKEKKPRTPSEYNNFIKTNIAQQKQKMGTEYNHKTAFKNAADAWSNRKKSC